MDIGFWQGNLGKRGHLKEIGVNGTTILKMILKFVQKGVDCIYVALDRRYGGFL
jgi:hypothetical protein